MLQLDLVTPVAQVLSQPCHSVSVPTGEGEITVLADHARLLGTLASGVLRFASPIGEATADAADAWFVADGFVEASATRVLVLAERADPLASLDAARARASLADAERRLTKVSLDSAEYHIQEKRRRRAQARLLAVAVRDQQA